MDESRKMYKGKDRESLIDHVKKLSIDGKEFIHGENVFVINQPSLDLQSLTDNYMAFFVWDKRR